MALDLKQEWAETDPKFRWIMIALGVSMAVFLVFRTLQPDKPKAQTATASAPLTDANGNPIDPNKSRVLPATPRNQGIEDLKLQVQALRDDLTSLKPRAGMTTRGGVAGQEGTAASAAASAASTPNLDAALPGPINFDAPGAGKHSGSSDASRAGLPPGDPPPPAPATPERKMKIWASEEGDGLSESELGVKVIPVNSALESVMLTGINARPSGSIGGAVGSVNSANNVGAPFVTRIKGDASLPNGWKLNDLGDCFLGGSGIAVLSTERAYVIAANLSCVAPNGLVYEGPIKAYGVDVDGTLGIAGKVVSKQGTLLLQAALTGLVSGLGTALSPQQVPAYNSTATNGSTATVQYPNPAAIAQTAVGTGINQAAGQLSKFYLEYAKEVFPVVEVTSQTRVTWVLTESVELKPHLAKAEKKS
jgi:conjugal transfer pilus assembly protein TraB